MQVYRESDDLYIKTAVQDSGVGMSKDLLSRIFLSYQEMFANGLKNELADSNVGIGFRNS